MAQMILVFDFLAASIALIGAGIGVWQLWESRAFGVAFVLPSFIVSLVFSATAYTLLMSAVHTLYGGAL